MIDGHFQQLSQVSSIEHFEILLKKDIRGGEEKLMLAVLENAVKYFQKYVLTGSGRRLFEEAEQWFLERGSEEFFSFENICEALQLDPDYVRQGLLRWKKETLKTCSVDGDHPVHRKLGRSRITYRSGRISRTA